MKRVLLALMLGVGVWLTQSGYALAWSLNDCIRVSYNHPDCEKYKHPTPTPTPTVTVTPTATPTPVVTPEPTPIAPPQVAPPSGDTVDPCVDVTGYVASTQPNNPWLSEPDCGFDPPALVPPVSVTPTATPTPSEPTTTQTFAPTPTVTATPPAFTPKPPEAGSAGYTRSSNFPAYVLLAVAGAIFAYAMLKFRKR